MAYLYVFVTLVFISYVLTTTIKYGVLGSISESYYKLPKNLKFLFTFFCWGIAIPTIIIASSPLMFFAGAGICFAGAAAAFKEKMTHDVHMTGAFTGIIFSQLSILLEFEYIMIFFVFVIFVAAILILNVLMRKFYKEDIKYFFWIEIAAFFIIIASLATKI